MKEPRLDPPDRFHGQAVEPEEITKDPEAAPDVPKSDLVFWIAWSVIASVLLIFLIWVLVFLP